MRVLSVHSSLCSHRLASQLLGMWEWWKENENVNVERDENKSPSAASATSEGVEPEPLLCSWDGDRSPSEITLIGANLNTTGLGRGFGV